MKKLQNYGLVIAGKANASTNATLDRFVETCQQNILAGQEPLGGPVILPSIAAGEYVFFQAFLTSKESE